MSEIIEEPWESVHSWFGLSYANYLVWPRSLMQSMPDDWQDRFVELAEELGERYPVSLSVGRYVTCRDARGRFIKEPVPHYNRGRTLVEPDSQCIYNHPLDPECSCPTFDGANPQATGGDA